MGGSSHHQNQLPPPATSSRLGIRSSAAAAAAAAGFGEIVEVQGGHIVRSTGRKDRHSKVCTAKGPRDRRVRLSAHTAIQFYDVQDRLGYDRPSKAVDWLIKKAKSAIDELAELPPWNPAESMAVTPAKPRRTKNSPSQEQQHHQFDVDVGCATVAGNGPGGDSSRTRAAAMVVEQSNLLEVRSDENGSGFLPPSLDSDSIAETIKSFFPIGGACTSTEAPPPLIQGYHSPQDLLSRTSSSHNQDLRLSLQSFQDPPPLILHQHHHEARQTEPVLFSMSNNPLGFDQAAGWEQPRHHQNQQSAPEIGRFPRLVAWNSGGASADTGGGGGGLVFPSPTMPFQSLLGQSQLFSQRGTLQSSNTPLFRAWVDQHHHQTSITTADHHPYQLPPAIYQYAIPGIGFPSQSGEFSGFRIPAHTQGEGEEHDGIANKPCYVSRH